MKLRHGLSSSLTRLSRSVLSRGGFVLLIFLSASIVVNMQIAPFLGDIINKNKTWSYSAQREIGGEAAKQLFDAALYFGVIQFDLQNQHFSILTEREWNTQHNVINQKKQDRVATSKAMQPENGMDAETVLKRLWKGRGPGAEIRAQLINYNKQSFFTAIRDNSATLSECNNADGLRDPCRISRWQGTMQAGPIGQGSGQVLLPDVQDIADLRAGDPSVLVYGPLAHDMLENFRDWNSAAGQELTGQRVVFRPISSLSPSKGPLVIDIVGRHLKIPVSLQKTASLRSYCPNRFSHNQMVQQCNDPGRVVAMRLTIPTNMAEKLTELSVSPVSTDRIPYLERQARLIGQGEVTDGAKVKLSTYPLTNNIRLQCFGDQITRRRCMMVWLSASTKSYLIELSNKDQLGDALKALPAQDTPSDEADDREVQTGLYPIPDMVNAHDTDDATKREQSIIDLLPDGHLRLSESGKALGLDNVLGLDSRHGQTYLNYLSAPEQAGTSADLVLQIQPDAQKIVTDRFKQMLVDKKSMAGISPNLPARYDRVRRAAFVLLALDEPDNMGAIMAASAYPRYESGLSDWDIRAIKATASNHDPLANHIWQSLDTRYTPGSTFKIISALSFIDYATGQVGISNPANQGLVRQALRGMDRKAFRAAFDTDLYVKSKTIAKSPRQRDGTFTFSDASSHAPMHYASLLKPSTSCGRDVANRVIHDKTSYVRRYGLCEAIVQSSNIWFASVGLKANEDMRTNFRASGPLADSLPLYSQSLKRLWPRQGVPLIRTQQKLSEEKPNLPVEVILTDAEKTVRYTKSGNSLLELELTLNSYGQATQASPLAMASLAASVATNKLIRPFLAKDRTVSIMPETLYADNTDAKALLDIVREGMHGVVNLPSGTAQSIFYGGKSVARAQAERVFGKTGTATLAGHGIARGAKIYGSWFIGWINATKAPDAKPKYAFACAISHSTSSSKVCTALVSQILTDLEKAGL